MLSYKLHTAKSVICAWFTFTLCMLCLPAFSQEYTAKDSASFQKALAESNSDNERITHELELADYSIKKPGSFKFDLDNARACIAKAKELNTKLNSEEANGYILLEEGCLKREYGFSPECTEMVTQAISILKKNANVCLMAEAFRDLSSCYDANNQQQQQPRIAALIKSVALYRQCGNKLKTAVVLGQLGEMYELTDNFSTALKTVTEAIAINNSIHYIQIQGQYCILANVYYDRSDFYNAMKYYLQSLKISDMLRDSTMQTCETNNMIGVTLVALGQLHNAIPYYKNSLIIAKKHNDINAICEVAGNIVNCYLKLNQPKNALNIFNESVRPYKHSTMSSPQKLKIDDIYLSIFLGLKQNDNSKIYADEILQLVNVPAIDKLDRYASYKMLILYFMSIKNYSRELQFLIANNKAAEENGRPADKADNLNLWYKMDSAMNNYKNAYIHFLRYKTLADSIFNDKKAQQITQLQNQYEIQKKEDDIRLKTQDIKILTQNEKIDKAQLRDAQALRNVTLVGILVFILIAGMQYRRYQEKQKLNALITHKNIALEKLVEDKDWLLKEVHHRVKNNLHTVICLLESQASYLENDALRAIESSQHRIFAMSLIHQWLYQSSDIQTVDIASYLSEFINYLRESFGEPANITFYQEIEYANLDVSQAIPLALIVNEAITNAIKYAFPDNREGIIKIELLCKEDMIRLTIADNGVGIPESVQTDDLNSLGLELIKGLTNDLRGKLEFIIDQGTTITIAFNKA